MTINLRIDSLTVQLLDSVQYQEIIHQLTTANAALRTIIMTQQEVTDLLNKIDNTTNHTAANIQTIADTDQKISDEIDAFLASAPAGTTLTDAQVTQLQDIADRAQKTRDAADAQVAVLKAIAAKGAPTVPPPPPPVAVG